MEIYSTEEQQVEAIKRWLRDNGNYVIAGIVIGLGAVYGTSLYRDHQRDVQEQASAEFATVTSAISAKGLEARGEVEAYIDSHKGTAQAQLASLQLAKAAAEKGDFALAEAQLKAVLASAAKDDPLTSVVRLQLARVELGANKHDDALNTLTASAFPAAFVVQAAELEGDIQRLKGDRAAAHGAYQRAVDAAGAQVAPALREKLLDVADAAASSDAAPKA